MALQTGKFVLPKDRASIWSESGKDLRRLGTFQPENDNYVVSSMDRGILHVANVNTSL